MSFLQTASSVHFTQPQSRPNGELDFILSWKPDPVLVLGQLTNVSCFRMNNPSLRIRGLVDRRDAVDVLYICFKIRMFQRSHSQVRPCHVLAASPTARGYSVYYDTSLNKARRPTLLHVCTRFEYNRLSLCRYLGCCSISPYLDNSILSPRPYPLPIRTPIHRKNLVFMPR